MTATEASLHVQIQQMKAQASFSFRAVHYPIDSLHQVVAVASQRWLNALKSTRVSGMQLDALGTIAVSAGMEADAKQQFAARLMMPGLSFADRAFTYLTAVQAFADPYYPGRLSEAEEYLKRLDAMGSNASYWQFQAHRTLVNAYYLLGKPANVIHHGTRAIALVNVMDFYDRQLMFLDVSGGELYAAVVDALTGQPGGKTQIEQLNATLKGAVVPPATVIAKDTIYLALGQAYAHGLQYMITGNARLGTPAAPIVSNYWMNRSSPDSVILVNDGRVRVLEFGSFTCPGCLVAMKGLDRLQQQFPDIQAIFITYTVGSWGNRLVEPNEEAAYLTEAFVQRLGARIPIALWKAKKGHNIDGGITPQDRGPNAINYPGLSKPTIWIVDGKGILRRVILGYDRDKETQIAKTIQFLRRETLQ